MVAADIYEAFAAAVAEFAVAASPPLVAGVAFPGVAFTPPTDPAALWLECQFLPNETQTYGVSNSGPKVHRGIFQVKACAREGRGTVAVLALADALVVWFGMGSVWPAVSPVVSVQRAPWVAPPLEYDERIEVPVSVPYFRAA